MSRLPTVVTKGNSNLSWKLKLKLYSELNNRPFQNEDNCSDSYSDNLGCLIKHFHQTHLALKTNIGWKLYSKKFNFYL